MVELTPIAKGETFEPPKYKPLRGWPWTRGGHWSQLALFTTKPEDSHRYPRGYTPERMHEISDAMPPVTSDVPAGEGTHLGGASGIKRIAKILDRNPSISLSDYNAQLEEGVDATARARLVDIYSRSRINPSDLRNVNSISIGNHNSPRSAVSGAGEFLVSSRRMRITHDSTRKGRNDSILLHELGHANDPELTGPVDISDPAVLARVEGKAEGYSTVNTVFHRNMKNTPVIRTYDTMYHEDYGKIGALLNRVLTQSPDRSKDSSSYKEGLSTFGVSPDSVMDTAEKAIGGVTTGSSPAIRDLLTSRYNKNVIKNGMLSGPQWEQLSLFPDEYPDYSPSTARQIPKYKTSTYKD